MECLCGHHYGINTTTTTTTATDAKTPSDDVDRGGDADSSLSLLESISLLQGEDASFIHLPPSQLVPQSSQPPQSKPPPSSTSSPLCHNDATTAESNQRLMVVLQQFMRDPSVPIQLCWGCLQRLERVLESDADRLEMECHLYRTRILQEQQSQRRRQRQRQQQQQQQAGNDEHSRFRDGRTTMVDATMLQSLRNEIDSLAGECQQQETELAYLRSVRREQAQHLKELDALEESIEEEQNVVEIEAKSLDYDIRQFQRLLENLNDEADRLSSSQIRLPACMYDLKIDKQRGRLYPMINGLRLAYRPKGDIQSDEVQAAWSLATQLLLSIATLFHFQSRHWRIVPLSTCAKLLFYPPSATSLTATTSTTPGGNTATGTSRPIVYNMGHPRTRSSRAMLAWNALAHQLASCVLSRMNQACEEGIMDQSMVPRLPFEMTSTKIGSLVLTELNEDDDAGWSKVIHSLSANLLWMSDCASMYLLQQVLLSTGI